MDTIYPVIFYFLCYLDRSVSTYLFPPSLTSCLSGWKLYVQSFSISSVTRITVSLLIYFHFPYLPAVLDGHYISNHFLFPFILGLQSVYLFIFPFLYFLQFWIEIICPVIFYFLCYLDHSESTYIFSLSFHSCCSGWKQYIQSFLFLLQLGIQCVYLFIFPFLYFLLFWMDTICPVISYFFCHKDHSVSTYLFSLSFTSCCPGWTLYIQSFSISPATWNAVHPLIYFPFPWLPAVLDGHYISSHFLFPLPLGEQCVYWFIFPFPDFQLFWMDNIYPVIFDFLWSSDHSVSTILFPISLPSCSSGWTQYIHHFLFPLLIRSQCVYLFILPFLYSLLL